MSAALGLVLALAAAPLAAEPLAEAQVQARRLLDAAPSPSRPAARPGPKAPFTLRVLSYNIHGITPWSKDPEAPPDAETLSRYQEIARRLRAARDAGTGPQVVVIQEAWNQWSAGAARDAGYPTVVEGGSARAGRIGGSGIYLLSDFPVYSSETLEYSECTGFDCLATKGALHVRLVVPELMTAVDFYTTHMNADEPPAKPEDSMKARMSQIREFAAFVKRTRDPVAPAVLAADFNFTPGHEDYALFGSLLGARSAEEECLLSQACTGDEPGAIWRESVDHQYALSGARVALTPAYVAQTFREPHQGKPLSDHLGLEARYQFSRVP